MSSARLTVPGRQEPACPCRASPRPSALWPTFFRAHFPGAGLAVIPASRPPRAGIPGRHREAGFRSRLMRLADAGDTCGMTGHENFELATDGPKMIVVGLDGSRTSWRAASYANGLARRQGSRVTVVYVASPGTLARMAGDAAGMMADVQQEIGADLRGQVMRLAAERGVDTEFLVVDGD